MPESMYELTLGDFTILVLVDSLQETLNIILMDGPPRMQSLVPIKQHSPDVILRHGTRLLGAVFVEHGPDCLLNCRLEIAVDVAITHRIFFKCYNVLVWDRR